MRVLRLPVVRGFSTVAALLVASACGGPANNSALFAVGGTPFVSASGGGSGSGSASGGSSGSSSRGGSGGGVSGSAAGGAATSGGASGSPAGGFGGGGAPNAGAAGTAGGGGLTNGGGGTGSTLTDCSLFGNDATYYSETKHCYLVVKMQATFAVAKDHCMTLGAHLVTLSSPPENDFVWGLDGNDHWIGATDGKGPREMGAGTYAWVDDEPFAYTDWSAGQPNATQSNCADTMGGGMCYEHCGFQWGGGSTPGEWNDRLCTQMIEAVCEWDG